MSEEAKLSSSILPINYDLFLEPNLEDFTFNGRVRIKIKILKPIAEINLNSKELKIKKAELYCNGEKIIPEIKIDEKSEVLGLKFKKKLLISEPTIDIEFEGILNDKLIGFYRSKYFHNNKEKYLATTQFEAPFARYAFPCFDEPNKKATFDFSLLIDKNLKAVSNMPIKSEKIVKSKKLINFQTTPVMSTYLFYIGVGDFEFLEDSYKNKKLRVVTTPGKSLEGEFAIGLAKLFLEYFENYSRIDYPLPKLDLIAIPDFAAGAMENWGAITFREILLLSNEKTSLKVKRRIAEVVAHELWHQWSGNLVTMEWWDDLWLNESFATFMAYKAVDYYFPEWNMWEEFLEAQTSEALESDSLKTTHPIEAKVKKPNEIEEIFDNISYGKGGSILRMIESYVGEEAFKKGVSNYLKEHEYKNAVSADFWNHIANFSDIDAKEIIKNWVSQSGYPLIEIKEKKSILEINQERFNKKTNEIWKIPLKIKTQKELVKILIEKRNEKVNYNLSDYIKPNYHQTGFYRVNYSNKQINGLKNLIEKKELPVFDRWGIQNDMFNLCLYDYKKIGSYLDLMKYYKNEDSYFVLLDIYSNLYQLYALFSQESFWEKTWLNFKSYISEPFKKNLLTLSFYKKDKESINDTLLRSLCISFLGFVQDENTVKEAFELFKNPEKMNSEISGALYYLIANNGSYKEYEKIIGLYLNPPSLEEKIKLLNAIYRFKDKKIMQESLQFSLSDKVRIQDFRYIYSSIKSNPFFRYVLFDWIKSKWNELIKYKESHHVFKDILEALIISYPEKHKKEEIRLFLKKNKIQYEKTKANSFEISDINEKFIKTNSKIIENYFK